MNGSFKENEGAGIADEVDTLLRSRDLNNLNEEELPSEDEEALVDSENKKLKRENFIVSSVISPFFDYSFNSDYSREENAINLNNYFQGLKKWVNELSDDQTKVINDDNLELINEISIKDVHDVAEDRFNFYSSENGRALIGSKDFKELREKADYWSRAQEIAKEAVEIDIRKGFLDF